MFMLFIVGSGLFSVKDLTAYNYDVVTAAGVPPTNAVEQPIIDNW